MTKKTYELFTGKDLEIAELIQQRRLQMLVHSCLYYELDTNIISDKIWSEWAVELAELQSQYPDIAKQVIWADAFKEWDGTTGAFLPLTDPWVVEKARKIGGLYVTPKSAQKSRKPQPIKRKVGRLF